MRSSGKKSVKTQIYKNDGNEWEMTMSEIGTKKENEVRLQKKLSPVNVWSLSLGCIVGGSAFVMPANTFLVKAGPLGTAIAMSVAALIMIVIAFNYHFMINRYPIAGGEFTYTNVAFGGKQAFICSWFLGLSYLSLVALNATALAFVLRNLITYFEFGFHYVVAGYDIYFGEILLAVFALVFFGILSIRGVQFTGVFQTILVFSLVGGVFVVLGASVVDPSVKAANILPLFNPEVKPLAGILGVVAVAPWAFVGFDTIPQAAEEFRFSAKKTRRIMVLSVLFGGAVYVIINTVTAVVVPAGYSSWVEYLRDLPNLSGLMALPTFHAAYQLLGKTGLFFIGIAVVAACLSGIVGFYMATSRLLYSMAKESVIPGWFGRLHPKYKTPANAILFVLLVSLAAPFFGRTAILWIVDMASIGAAIGYGYTSAAAFVFAKQEKNKGIMVTGVLGTLMSVMFAVLLLVPIPFFNCSLGRESYICLLAWVVLGLVFYLKTRGLRTEDLPEQAENAEA